MIRHARPGRPATALLGLALLAAGMAGGCAARPEAPRADARPQFVMPHRSAEECGALHARELAAGVGSTLYVGCP